MFDTNTLFDLIDNNETPCKLPFHTIHPPMVLSQGRVSNLKMVLALLQKPQTKWPKTKSIS